MRHQRPSIIVLFAVVILGIDFPANPQSTSSSDRRESEIRQALATFLTAFDNLDWPSFRACFAPDANMFHPAAPNVKRIDSPQEFDKAWLGVFARIRQNSGRHSAPYMSLQPEDLKIQMLSKEIALVSFHLHDANVLSRRTILYRRDAGVWRIVHIHASNLVITSP